MPAKRLLDSVATPSPAAKKARQTPPKMPLLGHLRGASKEELVQLLKQLCSKHPEIRDDVRAFSPDVPVDKMLSDLSEAAAMIERQLPLDRYGPGNHLMNRRVNTYAYCRARPFITSFAKLVTASIKTVKKSCQADAARHFVSGCQPLVDGMHEFLFFESESHKWEYDAAKSRLRAALRKL
mmetsp:Transcript_7729/g.22870  ORF Transcript_7729/g.22870 Transcript_7729/m.22870 type:complete len:181 (+) Transcript_7729:62-604(+)